MAGPVTTVTLTGVPATVRKLLDLPAKIQARCMRKAVNAGGAPLVKAAKRFAPRLTGLFKRSLDQKIKSYRAGQVVVSIVGQKSEVKNRRKLRKGRGGISGRGDLVPVHFVEESTKPHRIPKAGRGPLVLRSRSGASVIVGSVQHPGTRGQHPIRRAADAAGEAAIEAFADKLTTEVDIEAAKIAAGA